MSAVMLVIASVYTPSPWWGEDARQDVPPALPSLILAPMPMRGEEIWGMMSPLKREKRR
jgi:hypothetical protein